MEQVLLLSVVILLQTSEILMNCRVVQTVREVDDYECNSIQELRESGSPEMVRVSIYDDASIPSINAQVFQKSANLERIVIKNSTYGVKPDAFLLLQNLSYVTVTKNWGFEKVTSGAFRNLPIQYINLNYNAINTIEEGAFFNLTNLHTLRVSGNNLRRIPRGIFNNLTVETLSLSNNKISIIDNGAFMDLKKLKRLHLDGNLLTEFESEVLLNYGASLKILWLHNNLFTTIDQFTVKDLNNLVLLNLQHNAISEILPYTFHDLQNLEVLLLSNNSLRNFEANIFSKYAVSNIKKLYLDNNWLSFLTTKVVAKLANLKHISMGGNPWQCPCMELILTWLSDNEIQNKCDKGYFDGSRPACIVTDDNPTKCVYTTDPHYRNKYKEAISSFPKSPPCAL